MLKLPKELIVHIASYLEDVRHLRKTSKFFNSVTRERFIQTTIEQQRIVKVAVLDGSIFFLKNNGQVLFARCSDAKEGESFDLFDTPDITESIIEPTCIPILDNVKDMFGKYDRIYFVLKNGEIKALGSNKHGKLGTGDPGTLFYPKPITLKDIINIKQISVGKHHTIFLTEDNKVKTCGSGTYGKLGIGVCNHLTPTFIPDFCNVVSASAGEFHSVFLKEDGTPWICGDLTVISGINGDAANSQVSYPILVPELCDVKEVSAGRLHTLFLKKNGTVWASGDNSHGQLGLNEIDASFPLTQIPIFDVISISAHDTHTFFVKKDVVFTCGANQVGALGLGVTNLKKLTPTLIPGIEYIRQIYGSSTAAIFIGADGIIYACGLSSAFLNGAENLPGRPQEYPEDDQAEYDQKFYLTKTSVPRQIYALNHWYDLYIEIKKQMDQEVSEVRAHQFAK